MTTHSRFRSIASAADLTRWLLNLLIRLLARMLNMPEPLVHTTGVIVFAQVQAAEASVGKTLCPLRLRRRLRSLLQSRLKHARDQSARRPPMSTHPRKGELP